MHRNQPHIPSAGAAAVPILDLKPAKRRGNYNCSRCGMPKKGHSCNVAVQATSAATPGPTTTVDSSCSASRTSNTPQSRQPSNFRRALSFDDVDVRCDSPERAVDNSDYQESPPDLDPDEVMRSGGLSAVCLWEVLRRLPPVELIAAAGVCKGWRDTARSLWRAAEELRLRVPRRTQLGFVGSLLQKCPALVRLSLRMESDVDSTMLACIAFSCPNLESMEICTSETAVNRITG
ncbi:hypothetical protein SLEP1_g961 [Rubroshorea leprosula]|uniref:F-box domain-containing protein n=1 Tax=Rubroshorea leprosula TaxID=152421 RepID=A0AAV5HI46_9ROSI|nr:hypothetical protein SLEP1_g961 [Rubroshorea leprosula]